MVATAPPSRRPAPARGSAPGRLRHVLSVLRSIIGRSRRRWRRSLQLRVVAGTVVLGLVVVLVLGQFLFGRVRDGLMNSGEEAALGQAKDLIGAAQATLNGSRPTDETTAASIINQVVTAAQGPTDEPTRAVLILKASSSKDPTPALDRAMGGLAREDVSAQLRARVNRAPYRVVAQKGTLSGVLPEGVMSPHAVITAGLVWVPVAGPYELYIAFPLDRELQTLAVVRRTFLLGGFALVGLVAAAAYGVTRQTVVPVRQAAHTAEELASGRFDRRITVRGEDDLARLGRAFNEMAESLERQIHRLEELSRVQRRFVSDVSHELRTPLTTMRMAGELIYEGRSTFEPALARSAELLTDQLDRFEGLLADLLEISRFDAGAAVLEADVSDLGEIVARAAEGLRPLADAKGSPMRVRLEEGSMLAEVDARRVERVLRNLLGNAIDHGEGRPIDIRLAASEDAVAVGVRDHGVGLRPEERRMVFNRFWRADPARARTTGGTGLGLAIAQEDALLHGGRLDVWGMPGKGAHFVLTLPRQARTAPSGSPIALVPPDAPVEARLERAASSLGEVMDAGPPGSTTGGIPVVEGL